MGIRMKTIMSARNRTANSGSARTAPLTPRMSKAAHLLKSAKGDIKGARSALRRAHAARRSA